MEQTAINPLLVAFFSLEPVGVTLKAGSWGVASIAATTPATVFEVQLSPQFAGALTAAQANDDLHVTATPHQAAVTYAVVGILGGFRITFGAALTENVTIKVEKLIGE